MTKYGYRHIDTAPAYGNEGIVGESIQEVNTFLIHFILNYCSDFEKESSDRKKRSLYHK